MAAIDSCGHLLHAFGTPIQFVGKAITAEALAIQKAVERALQKGCKESHTNVAKEFDNILGNRGHLRGSLALFMCCMFVWMSTSAGLFIPIFEKENKEAQINRDHTASHAARSHRNPQERQEDGQCNHLSGCFPFPEVIHS
ncbi:hypothetical protein KY290_021487 [Solanum tuberosum]|uniref:RNase H type-1 domain-containing protein n=1 Tax=Solanum tuberosum TaxID=4113 RepID=A0ABQ7V1P3_SOLTU|nr:hypothetical protein KY289_020646 [Solanum tuberosum]KAH0693308.1 hypothetical protein KY285_020405 [Solanum tuberosum]KAH0757994.1 hypothetical protein KY290_021487 [Solanum tuberosum]